MAAVLHAVGAIYVTTMREFDALCLPNVYELSPSKIKSIRKQAKLSQAVFARIINVSIAAIKQWEQGEQNQVVYP